jgi:hypothetical protein
MNIGFWLIPSSFPTDHKQWPCQYFHNAVQSSTKHCSVKRTATAAPRRSNTSCRGRVRCMTLCCVVMCEQLYFDGTTTRSAFIPNVLRGLILCVNRAESISIMKPTWCTFHSIYWESRASTCFELPPSCVDCLEIWEPQFPGTLRACPGLFRDCFTFYEARIFSPTLAKTTCKGGPPVLSVCELQLKGSTSRVKRTCCPRK